ncbi:MAG: hypothetical protein GY827_10595 [Cytophagales bacterium]|nr:hypothetical protein [Cytophagales bacterium]
MKINRLEKEWFEVGKQYTDDIDFLKNEWFNIIALYNEEHRAYHNIHHILALYQHTQSIKDQINNYPVFFYTLIFHDVIYSTKQKNNEVKSAKYAEQFLQKIQFPNTDRVFAIILHTAEHHIRKENEDFDTKAFLDMDLAILGSDLENYQQYTQQIREEWKHIPSLLYKIGRKKVLKSFLNSSEIYRLPLFQEKYEKVARQNILEEIERL